MTQVRLFLEKLGANFQIYSFVQLVNLISGRDHPIYVKRYRALLNSERIRFFSLLFVLFTSLWLLIDYLLLAKQIFIAFATIKGAVIGLLLLLIWPERKTATLYLTPVLLGLFLSIFPAIFIASSYQLVIRPEVDSDRLLIQLYAVLPYLSVAGLGLFPLTVLETLAYALPLATIAVAGWGYFIDFSLDQMLPSIGLLSIMIALAAVSAAMQLQDMITLANRPIYDPLTATLSRQSGIANLAREFHSAVLQDQPFAVVLIELEDLDDYGKNFDIQTYDRIILEAADILGEDLRSGDTLVRWSGNGFLLMLSNTDCLGVKVTIDRLRKIGMGTLADGQPITAAIGAAERVLDQVNDWHSLLEMAEQRLQQAKRLGKDRSIYCGEQTAAKADH
jgi:diguanylate cyclase (GGDEF)-like protein